ncbi:MAG: DUF262 domain-containing protein [Actinomycetota bacterium]
MSFAFPMDESVIDSIDSKITHVRTQTLDLSFNELLDMYANHELIIHPEFQRMFRWSPGAQSRFIESLLLELPLPPIFLIEREDRVYELIDGLQRISSYLNFRGALSVDGEISEPLVLTDCDIVPELNGYSHEQLPRALEIKLKRAFVRAEILRTESDPRLRYHMFKRLNTGGERLSDHEVRNATIRLLSNDFNEFIIDLSAYPPFVATTDAISNNQRLRKFDQELVLRFFAFKNDVASYRHDIGDFLTEFMEDVSDPESDRLPFDYTAERSTFEKTFSVLSAIADHLGIGERIFGSVVQGQQDPRGQFSVYHYEGLTLGLQPILGQIDLDDDAMIARLAHVVGEGKADTEFIKHTGAGKNDPNPLRERISYFAVSFRTAIQP